MHKHGWLSQGHRQSGRSTGAPLRLIPPVVRRRRRMAGPRERQPIRRGRPWHRRLGFRGYPPRFLDGSSGKSMPFFTFWRSALLNERPKPVHQLLRCEGEAAAARHQLSKYRYPRVRAQKWRRCARALALQRAQLLFALAADGPITNLVATYREHVCLRLS